jgi:mono/diheme cytochrome c family protein
LIAVCLAALILAACGSNGARPSAGSIGGGAALFRSNCAHCHTLTGTNGTASGGDLAQTVLPISDLVSFERIMPVELTRTQLYAVARYLHGIETKTRIRTAHAER